MSGLTAFGIEPDAIDNIYEICEDIIQDVREFAEKLGYDTDADRLDFDFPEEVMYSLEDGFSVRNITNSIIDGCLYLTKNILEDAQICKDFGITFDTYANCLDSHLYFKHNGVTEEYYGTGDISDLLNEVLAQHLCDIICTRLVGSGECLEDDLTDERLQELKDTIVTDLDKFIDDEDVYACYCNWEITGTIREAVDDVIFDQKDATRKVSIGRD